MRSDRYQLQLQKSHLSCQKQVYDRSPNIHRTCTGLGKRLQSSLMKLKWDRCFAAQPIYDTLLVIAIFLGVALLLLLITSQAGLSDGMSSLLSAQHHGQTSIVSSICLVTKDTIIQPPPHFAWIDRKTSSTIEIVSQGYVRNDVGRSILHVSATIPRAMATTIV